jgi:hypothetical protein
MKHASDEHPSVGDLIEDPASSQFAIVDDVKAKPKGKPKVKRVWLPGHMVINTRLIIGLVSVTALAVGLSVYTLSRPARVEPVFYPTVVPLPTQIPIRAVPIIVTATPREPQIFSSPTGAYAQDLTNQVVMLSTYVFGYPAGTLVRVGSTWIDNWERWYSVTVEDGTGLEVRESQLMALPATPTPGPFPAKFAHLAGIDVYTLVTIDPVAEIPVGARVRVNQVWYDENSQQWMYDVSAEGSSLSFTAMEWELQYFPPMMLT